MLGKIGGRSRKGWQSMRWLDSITGSMGMGLSKFQVIVKDREAWHAVVHRVAKSCTLLSDWTTTTGHLQKKSLLYRTSWWEFLEKTFPELGTMRDMCANECIRGRAASLGHNPSSQQTSKNFQALLLAKFILNVYEAIIGLLFAEQWYSKYIPWTNAHLCTVHSYYNTIQ